MGLDAWRGDYSAFVMLGVDEQGLLLVEADLERRPTPQIVIDGVRLYRRFKPDLFAIETNQFQELLASHFALEFNLAGLHGVAIHPLQNHLNKLVRIRKLGPFLSMHRLRFKSRSPSTRLLVDQLRQFPQADHDDGPDALEMAVRMLIQLQHGKMPDDGLGDRLVWHD